MEIFLLIVGFLVLALVFRLIAGSFDGERIERYVQEQGWTLVDKSWDPFGPGWFGEQDSRIYQIAYADREGNIHKAHVKTSMMSGVYLTRDVIVQPAGTERRESVEESEPTLSPEELRRENEDLRRRIAELERRDR